MINSMIGAFTAHSGKKPIEKTTEYKENHILGASMISEYMIKFLDVTNDSDLTSEIIDDSQFLDSVKDKFKVKKEQFNDLKVLLTMVITAAVKMI
jgi:hypothetical protein